MADEKKYDWEAAPATESYDWESVPSRATQSSGESPTFGQGLERMATSLADNPIAQQLKKNPTGSPADIGAIASTLGNVGSAASTGALDLLSRFVGKHGLDQEDIQKLKSSPEILQKHFDMSPLGAWPAGLMLDAKVDPTNAALGLAKMGKGALSKILEMAGKETYFAPMARSLSDAAKKYRSGYNTAKEFKNIIWNEGEPLLGKGAKTNSDVAQQLTGLRQQAYEPIQQSINAAGADGQKIHLAPNLDEAVQEHLSNKMDSESIARHEGNKAKFQQIDENLKTQIEEAAAKNAADPIGLKRALSTASKQATKAKKSLVLETAKADAQEVPDTFAWLKSQLHQSPEARQQALDMLQEHTPDLAEEIKGAGKHLANSPDKGKMLNFFEGLINDLKEGPRTLEQLNDLKKSYGQAAAGGADNKGNAMARAFGGNQQKTADMFASQGIGDAVDKVIEDKLGPLAAPEAAKKRYSALRRLEVPLWNKSATQDAKHPGLFQLLGGATAAVEAVQHGNWLPALMAGTVKAGNEVMQQPKYGMMAGRALNNLSKTSIWDQALRAHLLRNSREE